MCGIAGIINFYGHDQQKVRQQVQHMTDSLAHRGPDAEGFYVDNFAAMGHRRLSIIDRAGGHQPMATMDGQYHIVFNGEIYNFTELRRELKKKNHSFVSESDTEVILAAYRQWGAECVERFNGMFAFAIWHKNKKQLFLARDRVGKKPLYYFQNGPLFAFASELKALLACNIFPENINPQALDCYFSFGYVPAPMTIFTDVKKLQAAHILEIQSSGQQLRRYWALSFAESRTDSIEQVSEEFEELFDKAVSCRLMSEVPLGAFLSGGIDSTLVVSSMAKTRNRQVKTNSIGFDTQKFNELPVARMVAEFFDADHREFVVAPNASEVIFDIARFFDEPFADSSALPMWYLCQMTKQNVTVALSGDGGDESFGGYTFRYLPHVAESKIRALFPAMLRGPIFGTAGAFYPGASWLPRPFRIKTILENLSVSDAEAFYRDLVWLRSDNRDKLYAPDFVDALRGYSPFEEVWSYYTGCDGQDPLSRSQYTDINFYMTDDVLVKVDRMSMAHSLEVRSPLLDYRILEFASRLPSKYKLSKRHGKIILRRLAAKRLPAAILEQPKRGFSIPAASWLRNELKPLAKQLIFKKNSFLCDYVRKDQLEKMWKEHQNSSRDHNVFLWGAMMLSLWADNFKKRVSHN